MFEVPYENIINKELDIILQKGEKQGWKNSFKVGKFIEQLHELDNKYISLCSVEDTDSIYKELEKYTKDDLEYGLNSKIDDRYNSNYLYR